MADDTHTTRKDIGPATAAEAAAARFLRVSEGGIVHWLSSHANEHMNEVGPVPPGDADLAYTLLCAMHACATSLWSHLYPLRGCSERAGERRTLSWDSLENRTEPVHAHVRNFE